MTGRLATGLIALALAAGCGSSTPNPPKTSEPAMPPTPTREPPPSSGTPKPRTDLTAEKQEVRSVVERYVAAITARDEPTAAQYTCQKKDGGYLWISSAGKPITVHERVVIGGHIQGYLGASVEVQVRGKPPSDVVVLKIDGTWCVWL